MFRQIGNRIGEELSFSLNDIDSDFEFMSEVMDWWEYAGLGDLNYDISTDFRIIVDLDMSLDDDKFPIWELDDGILQGALFQRFSEENKSLLRRTIIENSDKSQIMYEILK